MFWKDLKFKFVLALMFELEVPVLSKELDLSYNTVHRLCYEREYIRIIRINQNIRRPARMTIGGIRGRWKLLWRVMEGRERIREA